MTLEAMLPQFFTVVRVIRARNPWIGEYWDDVAQDAWVIFTERYRRYEGMSWDKRWYVRQQAEYAILESIRQYGKERTLKDHGEWTRHYEYDTVTESLEDTYIRYEEYANESKMKEQLEAEMSKLTPKNQMVLWLWARGESWRHIAEEAHVTISRVSQIMHRHAPGWRAFHFTRQRGARAVRRELKYAYSIYAKEAIRTKQKMEIYSTV